MADVRVQIDDAEVQAFLRVHGPRKVHNALRSAIRTTTTWADREFEQRLAAETEIPLSVFRRFRVKKRNIGGASSAFGQGGEVEKGYIWGGFRPIKARFVGKMTQDESGAWAGVYRFDNAFITTLGSGLTAIFKRRGRARLPIDEQTVTIAPVKADAIAGEIADKAGSEAINRFRAKFNES